MIKILVDNQNNVVESSSNEANLVLKDDPSLRLFETDEAVFVGDRFVNGKVVGVSNANTERGKSEQKRNERSQHKASIKAKLIANVGLTEDEADYLLSR